MLRRVLPTLAVAAACLTSSAAGPVTRPAAPPGLRIGRWFDQLADPDPAVRDAAQQQLMGLDLAGLDQLRAVVRAAGPAVTPAQVEPLRDIVTQCYLAHTHYVGTGEGDDPNVEVPRYVMGIRLPEDVAYSTRLGVPVIERWPGFPARQMLRDGDMILGVFVNPGLPLQQVPNVSTHAMVELQQAVQRSGGRPRRGPVGVAGRAGDPGAGVAGAGSGRRPERGPDGVRRLRRGPPAAGPRLLERSLRRRRVGVGPRR